MIDIEGFMLNFWFKHGLNIKLKTPKNDHKTKESHFCNSLFISGATRTLFSLFNLIVKIKKNKKYVEL